MRAGPTPEARSGLPRPIERRLMRHYGRTPAGRIRLAAALRALGVLVRHHPKAALEALGAGAVQAGRVGVQELTRKLRRYDRAGPGRARRPLTRREMRAFREILERGGPDG
jgi:hypothetical protein